MDFEHVIISDILFTDFFAYQILICFISAAHASLVLSPLHLWCVADFEQVIVQVLLLIALLVIRQLVQYCAFT